MTTLREAAQQALEACEQRLPLQGQAAIIDELNALRAALAEPVQEPAELPLEEALKKAYYYTEDGKWRGSDVQEWDRWHAVAKVAVALTRRAALAEPVQEPVQQALVEADCIMGHDDEATEWRERWAHLFGVAGSATSPWRESAAQGCSLGGTGMPATPPQRPAEPMVWTTQFDINWALNNPGRAGSFYANKEGSNDIALYTTPPVCGRVTEPVQEPVAGRAFLERILTAMEGVIDVADRKTDEFDALRSCVIDLTLMLHTAPPQRKPLTEEEIKACEKQAMVNGALPFEQRVFFARAIERAHGIGGSNA